MSHPLYVYVAVICLQNPEKKVSQSSKLTYQPGDGFNRSNDGAAHHCLRLFSASRSRLKDLSDRKISKAVPSVSACHVSLWISQIQGDTKN